MNINKNDVSKWNVVKNGKLALNKYDQMSH